MATGTRPAMPSDFPIGIIGHQTNDPNLIELMWDAAMVQAAEDLERDKCVTVGCITLIVPELNRDGFCHFHRPSS